VRGVLVRRNRRLSPDTMTTEGPDPNKPGAEPSRPYSPENIQGQPDIFERLKQRGIEYEQVMKIVQFGMPQNPFFFARQFGNGTIKEVLKHIESWKQFLKGEYLLTEDLKRKAAQWVEGTEGLVWATIRDINVQIGDWNLVWLSTPPGQVETPDGEHVDSGVRVVATNQKTNEQRTHELPGYRRSAPRPLSEQYQEIYAALGLSDELWLRAPGPFLISRRAAQGWPAYARLIPALYDFLLPHYRSPGHYSDKIDIEVGDRVLTRHARYPKELLDDMRVILKMHHPNVFEKTTINQLKAAIQRHVSRKPTQATGHR